jgi:hypothetical protein
VIHFILQDATKTSGCSKTKIMFLDPEAIYESRHLGPMWWKDDHDVLSKCETCKEKQAPTDDKEGWALYITSDATMARQGCHMGTILRTCFE